MEVGEVVKIFLKGERPWGTIVEVGGDKIKVRIDNKLFPEYSEHEQAQFLNREFGTVEPLTDKHGKKKGDEVWCERGVFNDWVHVDWEG